MLLYPPIFEMQDGLHMSALALLRLQIGLAHDIVLIQPSPLFRLPLVSPGRWITDVPIRQVERCRFA